MVDPLHLLGCGSQFYIPPSRTPSSAPLRFAAINIFASAFPYIDRLFEHLLKKARSAQGSCCQDG